MLFLTFPLLLLQMLLLPLLLLMISVSVVLLVHLLLTMVQLVRSLLQHRQLHLLLLPPPLEPSCCVGFPAVASESVLPPPYQQQHQ